MGVAAVVLGGGAAGAGMTLLAGDSIAVGLSDYLHVPVDARVGIGSGAGAARIARRPESRVVVSLGANDDPVQGVRVFERRVRMVLRGRERVVWLTVPSRPRVNRALRRVAAADERLLLVDGRVPSSDGVHPSGRGYRRLAAKIRRRLR